MPSAKKLPRKTLVLGSGALQIGQAGEFDYSGTQALKALREENIETVLINPNIATVQTDPQFADKIYFLPLEPRYVEEIIKKEMVDSVLLSFGGQTALNCGVTLHKQNVFDDFGVRVLGTPIDAILKTEDRELFNQTLQQIDVKTARSFSTISITETLDAARFLGFPVMIRCGFALGGLGSGIAQDEAACVRIASQALRHSPSILIEECLLGWKELEYEVVRDGQDNCVTVCNMENIDPVGIHTGESIVIAPSQTLTDREYHFLRALSIDVVRHLKIEGECNIQFAFDQRTGEYRVIEVNARLSRSSALASKATGYPLAYVAAKIALGYSLSEIKNKVTGVTSAFFEPALDYIVCKIPRWDFDKFPGAAKTLGTEMKSTGEVMGIGKTFEEAIQKAARMLDTGAGGVVSSVHQIDDIEQELSFPTPHRLFAITAALQKGMTIEQISRLTHIDLFYLHRFQGLVTLYQKLSNLSLHNANDETEKLLLTAKRSGFSDEQLSQLLGVSETFFREWRINAGIRAGFPTIDTLAAEYPATTNFRFRTFYATEKDDCIVPKTIVVLGAGCYRIGSSVEFDWCIQNCVTRARQLGYQVVLINCNPETVSTDFDMCDVLIFDEIAVEVIKEIYDHYHAIGIVVSVGGQLPNTLAEELQSQGMNILGTSPTSIAISENRSKFSRLLDHIGVAQPKWGVLTSTEALSEKVSALGGFPILARPSYVLSGAHMRVLHNEDEVEALLQDLPNDLKRYPIVVTKFEKDALEIDVDAVSLKGRLVNHVVAEHLEPAGVHSGDATLVWPPQRISSAQQLQIAKVTAKLANALNITGPFNVQYLLKTGHLSVIECNLRASRSFPFLSKASGKNLIAQATDCIFGKLPSNRSLRGGGVAVKVPKFSFHRVKGSDPKLGVEMHSTGEVACFGETFEEAFLKAMLSVGYTVPKTSILLITDDPRTFETVSEAFLTVCTADLHAISRPNITSQAPQRIHWISPHQNPDEILRSVSPQLVLSLSSNATDQVGITYRQRAAAQGFPQITELQIGLAFAHALALRCGTEVTLGVSPHESYTLDNESA